MTFSLFDLTDFQKLNEVCNAVTVVFCFVFYTSDTEESSAITTSLRTPCHRITSCPFAGPTTLTHTATTTTLTWRCPTTFCLAPIRLTECCKQNAACGTEGMRDTSICLNRKMQIFSYLLLSLWNKGILGLLKGCKLLSCCKISTLLNITVHLL